MKWKIFFARNLTLRRKLVRLHHLNALFFLILSVTGLVLFSTYYRSVFPTSRIWVKNIHIWLGLISVLPVLFYTPKMVQHLQTLRKKQNHRFNLYLVLFILGALIISGFLLTFQRQLSPVASSFALSVHDLATWFGLPYVIYHSVTRSQWFKNIGKNRTDPRSEAVVINTKSHFYTRRTFLRVLTVSVLAFISIRLFGKWLKSYLPTWNSYSFSEENHMLPNPEPLSPMPIGEGRTGQFRNYTVTKEPTFTNENWSFTIDGLVKNKQQYNWSEFVKLKRSIQVSDFHCVTGWSVNHVTWEGIPLKTILQDSGVDAKAGYVKFYSGDGVYTDSLTIKQAQMEDMMVAVLMDGKLIPQMNGGPIRLITPKMYAYKSVKWLIRIELIENEHIGYWEERGYPKDAWV